MESRKLMSPDRPNHASEEFSVARAAAEFGIPRRTIYHWIRTGRLCRTIGSHGRQVLSAEDVPAALTLHRSKARSVKRVLPDGSQRAAVIKEVATKRGIQLSSARRRINRALVEGKPLPELLPSTRNSE